MTPTGSGAERNWCRTVAGPDDRELNPPGTGIGARQWHAVERVHAPEPGERVRWGTAVCEAIVTVATTSGPFDSDRWAHRTCPACAWTLAIRTDTVADQYVRLTAGSLAARVAAAVVAAQSGPGADYGLDHPCTVQLLAAVSAHAPTALFAVGCADGDCDHETDHETDHESGRAGCPVVAMACRACSLLAGGWAGEWEDTFLPECTIPAPCEVLRALAGHYGIGVPR